MVEHVGNEVSANKKNVFALTLSKKLPFLFAAGAILSGVVVGYMSIVKSTESLWNEEKRLLKSVVDNRKHELDGYLKTIHSDLVVMANSPVIINGVKDFDAAWDELGSNQTQYLQGLYIKDNPHPAGSKDKLDYAKDGSLYSALHADIHPWIRTFVSERGYDNVFLFDTDGNVLYSLYKSQSFSTNVNDGPWKDTGLGLAYRGVMSMSDPAAIAFEDFARYAARSNMPASFISKKITDRAGNTAGVLAFQMPIANINEIMTSASGLGETGEAFIVGEDKLMRSDSRFSDEPTILSVKREYESVDLAMAGEKGVKKEVMSDGTKIIDAYAPVDFEGTRWAVIAQIDEHEVLAPIEKNRDSIITNIVISSLVVSILGYLFAYGITRRIKRLSYVMDEVAHDREAEVPDLAKADELGDMARTLQFFKSKALDNSGKMNAIGAAQATIEFEMDGTILGANENFCKTVGYAEEEFLGKHHRIFVDESEHQLPEYLGFWEKLNRGESVTGEFRRKHKNGADVWIQATYGAILDEGGKPIKVVKYASDITEQKTQAADFSAQIEAIGKSQAVIEFEMDGTIIRANDNFLSAVGYGLDEIVGKKHSIFVEASERSSNEYKQFWEALRRGEYRAGEFRRISKMGEDVWIQASYNPIQGLNGEMTKVVKYASDITDMMMMRQENEMGMSECVDVLEKVAAGDLTNKMEGEYKGAFSGIKNALNETMEQLVKAFATIAESAQSVNSAAREIAAGSSDLALRTEQQASNLEETAASMQELTSTVRTNTENANNANGLSVEANEVASSGGTVVREAVEAMGTIEQSSQKISDIISVIDEIAFQTNLLALNAAVEAARAGDAGKGFAVVASEVRSLAGRSATASKEIKQLINESAGQVKTGAELVNQAGDSLSGIVDSVKQVSELVAGIAAASNQQSDGITEVNAAVGQMDEMTQQNAALVEENSAAAQSMMDQSQQLEKLVSYFKLSGSDAVSNVVAFESNEDTSNDNVSVISDDAPVAMNSKSAAPAAAISSAASTAVVDDGWEEF